MLAGFGTNGAVHCIWSQQNGPTGRVRHIKFIDALLVRQEEKSLSCRAGVLGAQIISVPGCTSVTKRALLQTFLSLRNLKKTLFPLLHCLFSFSNSDSPHSSSLSVYEIYIHIAEVQYVSYSDCH